jgi:hypothetical protein
VKTLKLTRPRVRITDEALWKSQWRKYFFVD